MNRSVRYIFLALVVGGIAASVLWNRGQDEPLDSQALPPGAVRSAPSPSLAAVAPEDLRKIDILDEIFRSRNDNDPRLDSELRELSDGAKAILKEKYGNLAAEKRNERGTIIFLLGRNLRTEGDFEFFCDVLRETPCLSLADCSGDPGSAGRENFDRESGEEVTLAYPQIVAIQALHKYLADPGKKGGPLDDEAWRAMGCAKDSRAAIVGEKAALAVGALEPRQ